MISTIIIVVVLIACAIYLRQGVINKNEELKAAFDKLDAQVKEVTKEKATEVKEKVTTAVKKATTKKESK